MVAFKEQHLALSAAEAEEEPSHRTGLLAPAAGKHQHEESTSLWRSLLSSLVFALPLASWSVRTEEKVKL